MLLREVEQDGRRVFVEELQDDRKLSTVGNSVMTSYHKELLRRLGFFAGGELVETPVDQRYVYDPEAGELVVENRIALPEGADPLGLKERKQVAAPTAD